VRRHLLFEIEQALRDFTRDVDKASTADKVDAGYALHTLLTRTKTALQRLKVSLRTEASSKFKGASSTTLEGSLAIATVAAPKPLAQLSKTANVAALRAALGDDFQDYFHEQHLIQPRPEALSRILTLPPHIRDLVLGSLEQDVGSGGVSFSPRSQS